MDMLREDWSIRGDMSPGMAPWDKSKRPDDPEGGAGGQHPVGAYMFREERDRSRSRSNSQSRNWQHQPVASPTTKEQEEEEEGEVGETEWTQENYEARYRERIMGHYVNGRWEQSRRPYGTQYLRDRRDIERQQWEGRGGTGRTYIWRYHLREEKSKLGKSRV